MLVLRCGLAATVLNSNHVHVVDALLLLLLQFDTFEQAIQLKLIKNQLIKRGLYAIGQGVSVL